MKRNLNIEVQPLINGGATVKATAKPVESVGEIIGYKVKAAGITVFVDKNNFDWLVESKQYTIVNY